MGSCCDENDQRMIGTEGLRKKIIHKGISWQTPITGDEVQVHYTVSLEDGGRFDSSRDKGTPFTFRLGQGEVIKGWDQGIATMRRGERAVFTIPPELAYGETGSPPMVPSYSTLIFDVEMISWYPIRDISGDGGITKKITREGEGWATPNNADEVFVKYVAKVESGDIISRSEEGLEFSLIKGHLYPAVSTAVKTMRKGEKAELFVKFSYGLEHCRNEISTVDGTVIPHNPNLIIYLELISWKTIVDVTGDYKILKKITKTGEGFDRPNEGSLAKVTYIGRLEDGSIFERKGTDEEPLEYICEEEHINQGLDRAIMTMRKGEEALVTISPGFFTGSKLGDLISGDPITFEIKLLDFTKEKPFWKMNSVERMEACERKKFDGNILFKAGKYQLASKKYEKASTFIDYQHSFSDEEKLQANSLKASCYLNNAACKLKMGEYPEVSRLCTKALELDPLNVKALFRRAEAYLRTSDLQKAEEDIKHALVLDPNNKDVKIKHRELKDQQRKYVQHEVKLFSSMISRMN